MSWLRKIAQSILSFKETCLAVTNTYFNIFQKISEIENSTVIKYENVQNTSTQTGSQNDHQRPTGLYESVNGQPETPICVIETKGQGQYDNIQPYDKKDKKNVYEDLQTTIVDHPYADMELK